MFPQTELDNYKLQVELLHEKLKRSEEQRKQLEEKFESIMMKRSEQEKIMKMKSRIKYQQFLEEQRERNERNRALIKLLERVDQQAASLSARSERLKMMKLQYELYFAKLLQAQNMRSIQSSPQHYPMRPLNHIITNANLPIGIQDICQSSSNLSKSSPTIPESWGVMPNNTSTANSNLPYRFPGNVDYFNGQILLSQDPLQRQVNLKSTFVDSMAPTHGYPVQIGAFADTRRNPIEFEHYKPSDLNMASVYMDNSSLLTSRPDNHNRNLNEIQNLGQTNSESDFHGKVGYNGYHERQVEIQRPLYQMSTSDKLKNIKQDGTRERMVTEVNEDENKTNAVEKSDEKSQPMNTIQRDIAPIDEVKPRTDESKENWIATEKSMKKVQDLFSPDKLLINTNKINSDNAKAPILWNFGGRLDPQDSNYPIQLGKREKLSMENIENAIYGERITPISRKKDMGMELHPKSPEKQLFIEKEHFLEKQEIKVSPTAKQNDVKKVPDVNESHDEKTDASEKGEKELKQEDSVVMSPVKTKPPTPVNESPTTTPPLPKLEKQEGNVNNLASETTSNQQYPEGYSQNYEKTYINENSSLAQKSPTGDGQAAAYPNYEYTEAKPTEQPSTDYQTSPNQDGSQITEGSQEVYPTDQYQSQEYQYQDYTQGQEYADYQSGQYPAEYAQQQYDPNAYAYNYEQGVDGTYPQDGGVYQGDGGNYPQGDGTYQQSDVVYQQGDGTYPANESYQQGDASYYQEGGVAYPQQDGTYVQGDSVYQDPNQQMYAQPEYNSQSYPENGGYPNEYTGADYSNYEEQKSEQLIQQETADTPKKSNQDDQSSSNVAQEITAEQDELKSSNSDSEKDVKLPMPPVPSVMPPSILATEKPPEVNANKKKKKVNFVDSESEESSSAALPKTETTPQNNDESDFDFSSN